ncbi:hypothetical protein, partial [Salmonella enterica]|uniref:hypothetical protein n=1 Tax=Salmonella enterica TaxID=28901 RepID=UPI003D2D4BBC
LRDGRRGYTRPQFARLVERGFRHRAAGLASIGGAGRQLRDHIAHRLSERELVPHLRRRNRSPALRNLLDLATGMSRQP